MYGPKWPFLLMYGSHDLRHSGFPRVNGWSTDPRDLGRHTNTFSHVAKMTSVRLFISLVATYN